MMRLPFVLSAACAAVFGLPVQAMAQEVISPPVAEPLCTASTGAEYYWFLDYGEGLVLYSVTDRTFATPNITVFSHCLSQQGLVVIGDGPLDGTTGVRAIIEAVMASEEIYGMADVAALLETGPYTVQTSFNQGDGCICALGS